MLILILAAMPFAFQEEAELSKLWEKLESDDLDARDKASLALEERIVTEAEAAWVKKAMEGAGQNAKAVGQKLLDRFEEKKQGLVVYIAGATGSGIGPYTPKMQVAVIRPDGTGGRQLTQGNGERRFPRPSPDGKRILFVGQDELRVVGIDGRGEKALTETKGQKQRPRWSLDGRRIAYEGDDKVCVVDADGGNLKTLTKEGQSYYPQFSADGKRVFFIHGKIGAWDVWSAEIASGATKALTTSGKAGDLVVSGDGTKLLFTENGKAVVMSAEGGEAKPVTQGKDESEATFGRDGAIYFLQGAENFSKRRIVRIAADGSDRQELHKCTMATQNPGDFAESPDGRWLLFMVGGPYIRTIFLVDIKEKKTRELVEGSDAAWIAPTVK
jgi:Tol biopolymer transport system component